MRFALIDLTWLGLGFSHLKLGLRLAVIDLRFDLRLVLNDLSLAVIDLVLD